MRIKDRGDILRLIQVAAILVLAGWLAACSSHSYTLTPNPTPYVRDVPTEYYLYLPRDYTSDREWPVFVGIHGFGGDGTNCLEMWQGYADREGFILVCPSLADESGGWYQDKGESTLKEVLQRVREECHTQERVFLAGFSAGATFVQGFAFANPNSAAAVAVLSAGSYYAPNPDARHIPFLVVIGDQDNAASLKGANLFVEALRNAAFSVNLHILPGVPHKVTIEALDLTIELYRQVTGK
jgi:poly(3-hydroxybutyrate) depolymerase